MEEKSTHASTGEGAHTRWSAHAPTAFGANTRRSDAALCDASNASANTPAACHTPRNGAAGGSAASARARSTSRGCATSHRTKSAALPEGSPAGPLLTEPPPRDAKISRVAPRCASQPAVAWPSAPVPPLRRCDACAAGVEGGAQSRTTTLPMLRPLCSQRNADATACSSQKLTRGRPTATRAVARDRSTSSVRRARGASRSARLSTAIAWNRAWGTAPAARPQLHTPRLPISSKWPDSQSSAHEQAVKSRDRLLSTTSSRAPRSCEAPPHAKAPPLRELHCSSVPVWRRKRCFARAPAVTLIRSRSQRA
mmetsp:Transcript_12915/g.43404  ORF Transcript_12915/g.43404 Transcript_12915/m.43404 type:complete len:310 (-) Transcript_12915:396-1325(-)